MLAGGSALRVKAIFAAGPSIQHLNGSAAAVPGSCGKVLMPQYTMDAFASRVGEIFSFHQTADANSAPVQLELVEVEASRHRPESGVRQSFSLMFALRSSDATNESTLHLRHDDFEACSWFVNRVVAPKRDPGRAYYEAVFG